MANCLGRDSSKGQFAKAGLCGVLFVVVLLSGAIIIFKGLFGPDRWKNVVAESEIEDVGTLCIGSLHDFDITTEFFIRLQGPKSRYSDWTPIGWNTSGLNSHFAAQTPDNRFHCIASSDELVASIPVYLSELEEIPFVVIYDQKSGLIWPTKEAESYGTDFWMEAWALLRHYNPELPPPPR